MRGTQNTIPLLGYYKQWQDRKKDEKNHDIQKYDNYISMADSQMRACVP